MIRWDWDPAKAASNLRKHDVSFESATTVYDDPFVLVNADPHGDGDRLRVIGVPAGGPVVVLFVVLTEPALLNGVSVGRIISARKATAHERRRYEEG